MDMYMYIYIYVCIYMYIIGGVMDPADPMNEAAVFSIAASLMVMVYANGSISGAHLNPAVTVTRMYYIYICCKRLVYEALSY